MSNDSYAQVGIETDSADNGLTALVSTLAKIDTGRPSRVVVGAGHYATVLKLTDELGVALSTDGVGTKVIVAQQMGKFDTVGIDCIAMNVNDIICVGAEPVAMVDYLAVEEASEELLGQLAIGLKTGAELAGIEIPGGELAQLKECVTGHPSPYGFDLSGACFGTVRLDRIISGDQVADGDLIIGLPSNGIHSNGYTLARKVLLTEGGLELGSAHESLAGTLGEDLLRPTEIYVKAIMGLLDSGCTVNGLAHITGDGLWNLPRLSTTVDYIIDRPLAVPALFNLIQELGSIGTEEMYHIFNMGIGFCVVVPDDQEETALKLLQGHYPTAAVIGSVKSGSGEVQLEF